MLTFPLTTETHFPWEQAAVAHITQYRPCRHFTPAIKDASPISQPLSYHTSSAGFSSLHQPGHILTVDQDNISLVIFIEDWFREILQFRQMQSA